MLLKLLNILRWIVLIPGTLSAGALAYLLMFAVAYVYSWLHTTRGFTSFSLNEINGLFIILCSIFSGYCGSLTSVASANLIAPSKKSETVRILCFLTAIILLIPIYLSSVNLLHIKSTDKSAVSLLWPLLSYFSSLYVLIPHALNFEFKYWKKSMLF